MRKPLIFFLILGGMASGILLAAADYGESSTSLGQFTDEYTDLNYTSVRVDVVRNATYNAMELNYIDLSPEYENFMDYIEFDTQGKITVYEDRIEFIQILRQDDGYVYYDYGVDFWDDWEIEFTLKINDTEAGDIDNRWINSVVCFTSYISDFAGKPAGSDGIHVFIRDGGGVDDKFRISLWGLEGGVPWVEDQGKIRDVSNNELYIRFNRTDDDIYVWIYTDSDYTTLDETLSSLNTGHTEPLQYIYGVQTVDSVNDGDIWMSGYVKDLWLGNTTGGYASEGYFTTTDYLDEVNGSILVLLTDTLIPGGTGITVEFSQDNSTWVNATALPDGRTAIDLRFLNWTSSDYQRYNLSGTKELTPRLYQSRLITTEGPIDLQIQNVSGVFKLYNATSILTIAGTESGGNTLNNTYWHEHISYNVTEVTGTPGLQVDFNFAGIPDNSICLKLIQCVSYVGVDAHDIHIDVYNFTGSAWVTVADIPAATCGYINVTLACTGEDYLRDGLMRARYHHPSAGNINDELCIDLIQLQVYAPFDAPAPTITRNIESDFPWIAIAIILMCVAYLLLR